MGLYSKNISLEFNEIYNIIISVKRNISVLYYNSE
jgi:hypothetical protein